MKTRKQQTLVKKRARPAPAKRSPRSQAAAPRAKAASRGKSAARRKGNGKDTSGTVPKGRAREDGALTLGAECTVAEADSLKAALASRLAGPEPVTVDVSALQRIDTAGLQLLAAFVRDRRTAGHAVQWRGRASALEAAAGFLGLKDMLELAGEVGR